MTGMLIKLFIISLEKITRRKGNKTGSQYKMVFLATMKSVNWSIYLSTGPKK